MLQRYISIFSAFTLVACHASKGGSGGSGSRGATETSDETSTSDGSTAESSSSMGSSTSANATSSTGIMMTCTVDMKCDLPAGETCGVCVDCVIDTPACGGCMTDGVCDQSDACTCVDCRNDKTVCPDFQCELDGICDYYTENCTCADCASDPKCQ